MTPNQIAREENTTDAFNAIYQDAEMMHVWLDSAGTLRDKLVRARAARQAAENPRYKFRLEHVPGEVKSLIRAYESAVWDRCGNLRKQIFALRADGFSWDEVWNAVAGDHGFGPGDARLLGVA